MFGSKTHIYCSHQCFTTLHLHLVSYLLILWPEHLLEQRLYNLLMWQFSISNSSAYEIWNNLLYHLTFTACISLFPVYINSDPLLSSRVFHIFPPTCLSYLSSQLVSLDKNLFWPMQCVQSFSSNNVVLSLLLGTWWVGISLYQCSLMPQLQHHIQLWL